jgi:hypothetical protein
LQTSLGQVQAAELRENKTAMKGETAWAMCVFARLLKEIN